MHTVVQESSSFNWVIEKIKKTFKLETKGLGVLAGADIKGTTLQKVRPMHRVCKP